MKHIAIRALPFLALAAFAAPASAQEGFGSCLSSLRASAGQKGISAATFDRTFSGVQPDMKILENLDNQPEFKTPIWDYLSALVDDERVADGQAALRQHARAFAEAERRFGVPRHVIAAVWGVESDFGRAIGTRPLVQSLATLSCWGRRQAFFQGELFATLKIIQNGDIAAEHLTGSWAGAFGHTQFMPTTYQRLAVDLDGDGRRDVVDSIPDALGSTANFLRRAGWNGDHPWGYEVTLPSGFNASLAGRRNKKAISAWAAMGVRRVGGGALTGDIPAGILIPAGVNGPAFLVTKNFDAIYSYNAAESYGLAIAILSDRLRGQPGVQANWPTDDPGLSRRQRREVQARLNQMGYDVGEPDGRIGAKTRAAIEDMERRLGLKPTGRAGLRIYQALRR